MRVSADGKHIYAAVRGADLVVSLRVDKGGERVVVTGRTPCGDASDLAAGDGDARGAGRHTPRDLVLALQPYAQALEATGGAMPEFVNPKYADAQRGAFKSPTRLECMMQDLPWLMPSDAPVSFTVFEPADTYCPVKNALADAAKKAAGGQTPGAASSAEFMLYNFHARLLRLAGAVVRMGREADIPTPVCQTVYAALLPKAGEDN